MTAAYAFTDYRSQGQTITYVIVDITTPPGGRMSLFNVQPLRRSLTQFRP
ncbi:uncharacterized protein LAESUDRAFT_653477 [Laetiporus sulphureus 93-53]|uniref:Uncharacterized protein n=1 Tax=Laetiporus sulphureus 93-53 TaxID=1314785 RepID=A0A165E844_9APHY|nr:uncharacterized protein LAESUDRAFT_653477 [Laetiporus sulphureus 93-53]KZT06428.1 hypothetical protein LAESUDRAFT_653477 [Laetiporus sulphureus 93-53]